VTNPFEDENGVYHVLINAEGQHSLWPAFVEVPDGWTIVLKSTNRAECLEYVEKNWTDMRPNSLIAAMAEAKDGQKSEPEQGAAEDGAAGNRETLH
jgi:MbtH protein